MTDYRSLETNRLEIVIIAAGVLVLVSVMGILILLGVGLRPPTGYRATENGQRQTPWGGRYTQNERRLTALYRDCDDTFVTSTRRRSLSLAEEIKNELSTLTYNFTNGMGSWSDSQQEESSILDTLRRFSTERMLPVTRRHSSDQDTCGSCCEFLDYPISVTGQEDEPHGVRIRLISNDTQGTSYDSEA